MEQKCKTCRYFEAYDGDETNEDGSEVASDGYCRRYPPSIHVDDQDYWPEIDFDHWCGEWQPANPETVEEGAMILARHVILGDLTAARALADKLKGD